jgi:plasmid stability protein
MARETQLNIRNFPPELKKKLQELAKQHRRSMTQEIIRALEEYVEQQSRPIKK